MSGKRDSNPRLSAWEADALPTELLPHLFLNPYMDFLKLRGFKPSPEPLISVPGTRLELARLAALAPETSASTIPPPGLLRLQSYKIFATPQNFIKTFFSSSLNLCYFFNNHTEAPYRRHTAQNHFRL